MGDFSVAHVRALLGNMSIKDIFLLMFCPGLSLRKSISELKEQLEDKTNEAQHLQRLLAKMEASANQEEMVKAEIADLKEELRKAEGKSS